MLEKCRCFRCNGFVEFDLEQFTALKESENYIIGQEVTCSHCQQSTPLSIPNQFVASNVSPASSKVDQPAPPKTLAIHVLASLVLVVAAACFGIGLFAAPSNPVCSAILCCTGLILSVGAVIIDTLGKIYGRL